MFKSQRRIFWLTLLSSVLILCVVVMATVLIYRAQVNAETAEISAVESQQAYTRLSATVREIQHHLAMYAVDGEANHLETVSSMNQDAARLLLVVKQWEVTENGLAMVRQLEVSTGQLASGMNCILGEQQEVARRTQAQRLFKDWMDSDLMKKLHQQCDKKDEELHQARNSRHSMGWQSTWLLWLMGGLGVISGLLAGYSLSRSIRRELVELSIPIHSAEGELQSVIGPMRVDGHPSNSLQASASALATQVTEVVQRLQTAEREVVRQEQLASLGQLAAGLAHELRNPLTAIKTLIETARIDSITATLEAEDISVIEEEVIRLNKTLQYFLDYARPPKAIKQSVNLSDAINKAIHLLAARAQQQNIRFDVRTPDQPIVVQADPDQLHQVFLNLLQNALDAISVDGTVTITVKEEGSKSVELRIQDTGPGIPSTMRDRLFEPFASSKPSGSGLGLAICKRIIEEQGGTIRVESANQRGACFIITLPR